MTDRTILEIAADPETTAETWVKWLHDQLGSETPPTRGNVQVAFVYALAELSAEYRRLLQEVKEGSRQLAKYEMELIALRKMQANQLRIANQLAAIAHDMEQE